MVTRFLKISSNGNKIFKSKLMTVPSYMIIFNFSFLFSIERKQLEEEQRIREEKERKEHEEYMKIKAAFSVEEEGFDEDPDEDPENKLEIFIQYVKDTKVVVLEDLAAHFKMKTDDTIDRVSTLIQEGKLTGVIDDRGKFIFISQEELDAVAKFITQRGRVSISELAENSNRLISLQTSS